MNDKNWDEKFGKRMEVIHSKVQEALGTDEERFVYYSAYNTRNDLPINNLNRIAFKGKGILVAKNDSFWGDGEDYESDLIEDPTWLQIAVLSNAMIKRTGDYHHSFLEGICRTKKTKNGITVFEFAMGS